MSEKQEVNSIYESSQYQTYESYLQKKGTKNTYLGGGGTYSSLKSIASELTDAGVSTTESMNAFSMQIDNKEQWNKAVLILKSHNKTFMFIQGSARDELLNQHGLS